MPAHLRDLDRKCQVCGKRATVALYNTFNAPLGEFCRPCGKWALKEQRRGENADA